MPDQTTKLTRVRRLCKTAPQNVEKVNSRIKNLNQEKKIPKTSEGGLRTGWQKTFVGKKQYGSVTKITIGM